METKLEQQKECANPWGSATDEREWVDKEEMENLVGEKKGD